MRASHSRQVAQPVKPVKFGEVDTGTRQALKATEAKERKFKLLKLPKDGIVRAIAHKQASLHYHWPDFERAWEVITTYCGLAVGFFCKKRTVQVEAYIYQTVQAAIKRRIEALSSLRVQYAALSKEYSDLQKNEPRAVAKIKRVKKARAAVLREIDRRDIYGDGRPAIGWRRWLELESASALEGVREYILERARNGRVKKRANHEGYLVVLAHVYDKPTKPFWLIINPNKRSLLVVNLLTERKYNSSLNKRRKAGEPYVNTPKCHPNHKSKKAKKIKLKPIVSRTIH